MYDGPNDYQNRRQMPTSSGAMGDGRVIRHEISQTAQTRHYLPTDLPQESAWQLAIRHLQSSVANLKAQVDQKIHEKLEAPSNDDQSVTSEQLLTQIQIDLIGLMKFSPNWQKRQNHKSQPTARDVLNAWGILSDGAKELWINGKFE